MNDHCIPDSNMCSSPNPRVAAHVDIDFSPGTEMRLDANVISWEPLTIQSRIWDPRLARLEMLIGNKLERGEIQAFESNVQDYLAFADCLLRQAVLGSVMIPLSHMQQRLTHVTTAIIVTSTILYAWRPWFGIAIDAGGIIMMLFWFQLLESRKVALLRLLDRHERSRPARHKQYCQSRLANVDTSGG